uniref:long-chain-fatty-acid--CoA ligase n=1 Tax=Stomoxys calcitrans TaxID=35570 RepID=A0A1I8NLK9_STOCA
MAPLKSANSTTSCSLLEPVKLMASQESLCDIKPLTIPEYFRECCQKFQDYPALSIETNDLEDEKNTWRTVTYGEYERHVEKAALALLYLGVGQRTSVSVLANNCPEWFYIQLGALRINAVVSGIYTTNSAEAVYHVLSTSNTSVVVVDDSLQLAKVREIRARLPNLRAVVQLFGPFDFKETEQCDGYYRWHDLLELNFNNEQKAELLLRERNVAPNECALLVYTSGTVGLPKGVMASHDAILFCLQVLLKSQRNLQHCKESTISYLPLSHIAAQFFDVFMSMGLGANVYFGDKNALKGTLGKTLVKAKPSWFFGVPRVFEKLNEQILQMEANLSNMEKSIRTTARTVMMQYHLDKMAGKPSSYLRYWWASKFTGRIKESLGLERIKLCMTASAPLSLELKHFFLGLDLPITEVFGLSETCGAVLYNFDLTNLETCGKPLKGIEVKLLNANEQGDGELCIRGRCNLMGYVNEPEKTEKAISRDGWFLTGDMASIDHDGNVYINGRLKEIIITAGGENIPPIYIENIIKKELPCISNALVVGDRRKYLTVLLTFKTEIHPTTGYPLDNLLPETKEWLEQLDLHYTQLSDLLGVKLPENLIEFDACSVEVKLEEKVQQALKQGIARYNQQAISNAQKVQYFTVLPHDFTFATEELGPTLKTRRNIIIEKYAKLIDKMYVY